MPDYDVNDPKGWCGDPRRGAAMGRVDIHDEPSSFAGQLSMKRIRMCATGDYDLLGTYWGCGDPLYWYANEEQTIDGVVRAKDREDARRQVLEKYPKAKVRK